MYKKILRHVFKNDFQYFVALLANLALKLKKVLVGPKNFLLSKFEEFHADSKTVEKNEIN